ncbi:MAG TPA: VOC family protein [Stellaceae bacterium]|nr:VOC family protein [Stellaceae bacterium]
MDGAKLDPQAATETQLPLRLHHNAFVVRDQETNRHFFEDILGMPLVATWCERMFNRDLGRDVDYCHTFFGLADGGALAFFQFADAEMYERSKPIFPEIPSFNHIAMKVDDATFDAMERRLKDGDVPCRVVDHGYCRSIYATSPDGLRVEFTVDPPHVDTINAMRLADAHSELARWLKGDRRVNNLDRH